MMAIDAMPAEIITILGRSGNKGIFSVKCKVLDGHDKGKVLTRSVIGPVRLGDVLMLRDTEMEASESYGRR